MNANEYVCLIVQHASGHRYSCWTQPNNARADVAKRNAPKVTAKFGAVAWSILVPDEVSQREIHTRADWDRISPETPGVTLYTRNGRVAVAA